MPAGLPPDLPPGAHRRIAGGCLFGFFALGLTLFWEAGRLQAELDTHAALAAARTTLEPVLRQGEARALDAAVQRLLRSELGFTWLAVRDGGGKVLASAGRYERLAVPLPALARQTLRRWLYALTSRAGSVTWTVDGRPLGGLDYAVSDHVLRRIQNEAVARLWWFGAATLLLAATLLAALRAWRRPEGPPATPAAGLRPPPVARDAAAGRMYEARAAAALGTLGRAVLLVDADARVRYLNEAAVAITGWTESDARGQLVYSVFHALNERDEPVVTPAELVLKDGGHAPPVEMRLRARDGEVRPIEAMAVSLTDADGRREGAVMFFHDISLRLAAAAALKRSTRLAQGIIDHLVEGVITTDSTGSIRFANARVLRMFGYTREELSGVNITQLMPVPFLNSPEVRLLDYIPGRRHPKLPRVVGWRKDATTFPVELLVEAMREEDGDKTLVLIVRDITERLRRENLTLRLGRLLDNAAEEIYIFDAQSLYFLEVNRGAQRNLAYSPEDLGQMTPLSLAVDLDPDRFHAYLARLRGGSEDHVLYRCSHRRADGTTYPVEVRLSLSREEEPPVFMAIAADISERLLREERLQFLANHDPLTGLVNRGVLVERLGQALAQAKRSRHAVAVLFLDMDRFKAINDTRGHEAGDAVLRIAAERIRSVLRAADTVARFGGDEFVVIAGGLHGLADAQALAQKLIERFTAPVVLDGAPLHVSVSIGLTLYPEDPVEPDLLLQHADAAMYEAKQAGRGTYRVSPSVASV